MAGRLEEKLRKATAATGVACLRRQEALAVAEVIEWARVQYETHGAMAELARALDRLDALTEGKGDE